MKQSKNLSCCKNLNKKVSLDQFILFCIEKSVKASFNGGNLWKVDEAISKKYSFDSWASARMYAPVFYYLCDELKIIKFDYDSRLWVFTKKKYQNKRLVNEIKKKYKDYFEAVIEKFNLNILYE